MKEWEKNIRVIAPYVPGEQPKDKNIIKLNTNENPYPPAPGVITAVREFDTDMLRLYPDTEASLLTEKLAEFYGLEQDNFFVGVGSDDVLSVAFQTFFNSDMPIYFPDITYSFYKVWADMYRIPYECKKLDDDFNIVKEDYYKENGGVIFPNPNAPTAVLMPLDGVEDIIRHNQDVIVIVDEAYIDFGGESAVSLLEKYENLLVVQTFSKARSMAGMRIGYAMGSKRLISAMNDVKFSINSYTMNLPSIIIGASVVSDRQYFEDTLAKIVNTRENAKRRFKELGFAFTDSKANFIFVSHNKYKAKDIFEYLKSKNIFVRYFGTERIDNYLRITIGTDEQMDKLFEALEEYID
ncbi:MAG: histidinol-phosphate transaminase [Lachnospiraceae bacterium]|nr:histidinol-phosphate transaminase [Lachnospiraceae bacterium]MDE6253241.1 histidinol-phosphate transaminase [Lachnospiraceae bacterium]